MLATASIRKMHPFHKHPSRKIRKGHYRRKEAWLRWRKALGVLPWQQPTFRTGEERGKEAAERGGLQMWTNLPRVCAVIACVNVPAGCVTFTVASLSIAAVSTEAFIKFGRGFAWSPSSYLAGTLICAAPSSDEWSPCTAEYRPSCTSAIERTKKKKQLLTKHAA